MYIVACNLLLLYALRKVMQMYGHLFLNNQPDALIFTILFCYKTLHVSGIFSAHHQEFSTVHSAPVISMPVYDGRFQAASEWNALRIFEKL